jgi:hypothetical protein
LFDSLQDDVVRLEIQGGVVTIEQGAWAPQGDAANWLVSETFGLEQARSLDAERAIEAAEAFMRGDQGALPKGLDSKAAIHKALARLLPAHDHFWPRWIVSTQQLPGKLGTGR